MSRQIYINGKFVPQEDAKISVFDHGLLYGDGVFEGLRSYGGKVFRLERASPPALRIGQGDLARDPDDAGRDGEGDRRHRRSQRHRRTATSAWSSPAAPARWGSIPIAAAIRR